MAALLTQPKRMALLAYLLLNRPGELQRRDTIVALLWPDADQERARNSLRQALHHLRRALGSSAIVTRGTEEVGIATDAVTCDALQVMTAASAKDWARALAAYRGDLLAGFHLPDAPDFDLWLEQQRAHLKALAERGATALAEVAEREGNLPLAVSWAERAAALAPAEEGHVATLLRLFQRTGDRAGAVAAYEAFATRLDRDFSLAPSPALAAQVDQVRRSPLPAVAAPPPASPAPAASQPGRHPSGVWIAGIVTALCAVVVLSTLPRSRADGGEGVPGSGQALAVLPFRVAGAEPSLGYLREGMIDLLTAKLTGEGGGLRATDPRTVVNAWRRLTGDTIDPPPEASLRLGRDLGASRVLLGGVVGRSSRLVLQAAVFDVATGAVSSRGSAEGPIDSLPELVDQLAARLLAGEVTKGRANLPMLAGTRLPVVRAYLKGEQAFRAGHYEEAIAQYREAVAEDSTFGPAAVGLAASGIWDPAAEADRQRGLRLAWRVRTHLGAADLALLTAMAGPRYPDVSPWKERLEAWERATRVASGRPEPWYEYGDILMHRGPILGIARSTELAQHAFAHAVALDSGFAPPLSHLFELAAGLGDTLGMKATAALFLARDSSSDLADYIRWRRATLRDDSRLLEAVRRSLPVMPSASLARIMGASQVDGLALGDALLAERILASRPLHRDDQVETEGFLMEFDLNRGHPREAAAAADALANRDPNNDAQLSAHILNALYADGDSSAAARVAERFRPYLRTAPPARGEPRALHLWKGCAEAQWALWHGDTAGVAQTIVALRRRAETELPWWAPAGQNLCAMLLEATTATLLNRQDASSLVARLDSLTLTGPDVDVRDPSTLALARLWARLGYPARALEAVRRRQYHFRTGLPFLATRLREEGGWALQAGDTVAAREAWRRFLVLYTAPDPIRQPLADSVRVHLAKLGTSNP